MMMKSGSGDPGKEFGRETKKLEGVARANGKIEGEEAMTQREETVKRRVRRGEMERCVRYEGQRANEQGGPIACPYIDFVTSATSPLTEEEERGGGGVER